MNLVSEYKRLDNEATNAEGQVSEWQTHVEEAHWAQCQIAYEAIEKGPYSQEGFAKEVGHTRNHIKAQKAIWKQFPKGQKSDMTYAEAYSFVRTGSADGDQRNRDLRSAKKVLKDPELAKSLLADVDLRSAVLMAIKEFLPERTSPGPRAPKRPVGIIDEQQLEVYAGEAEHLGTKYITALTNITALTGNAKASALEDIERVVKTWTAARGAVESNVADDVTEWLATQ